MAKAPGNGNEESCAERTKHPNTRETEAENAKTTSHDTVPTDHYVNALQDDDKAVVIKVKYSPLSIVKAIIIKILSAGTKARFTVIKIKRHRGRVNVHNVEFTP